MSQPTDTLRFRWPWRDYQARVLAALEVHLGDERLHVVAAPGSGKTVLGLEVFRRLARPAVVLSPTRTIRDQWLERLGDFIDGGDPWGLDWVGRDLSALRHFNSLTYQALHTRMRLESDGGSVEDDEAAALEDETDGSGPSPEEVSDVVERLRAAAIGVLILDEAHHLRAEWWSAISRIVEGVEGMQLVSLTATPPYDVVGREWGRYVELCGPIDEEISVPELVKAGTLCPHQDYVWLVRCEGGESARIFSHRRSVGHLLRELEDDADLLADLLAHAWVQRPETESDAILRAPEAAIAMAAMLAGHGQTQAPLLAMLRLQPRDLPPLDAHLWQHLLRHYLFGDGWPADAATVARRDTLGRRMRAEGLLWRRELNLVCPGRRGPRLSLAAEKAQACLDIHRIECRERGDRLRQVILTDFIRDEEFAQPVQRALPLGAWPIFHRLACGASSCRLSALALHSGRLSIVHRDLLTALQAAFGERALRVHEVPSLLDFVRVEAPGDRRLTRALTALLVAGELHVLVGTRALLGEGWDAPPVNSLILASVVGSFMTTNQMRGRAIRIDRTCPDKDASIWHIGAFARDGSGLHDSRDIEDMARRFETFVGLDESAPAIEGGFSRLHAEFWRRDHVRLPIDAHASNRRMAARLSRRRELERRWQEALDQGGVSRVLPSVRVLKPPRLAMFPFWGTLAHLGGMLLAVVLSLLAAVLQPAAVAGQGASARDLLLLTAAALALLVGPGAIRLLILWWRFLPVDGAVRSIALAVRDALCACDLLPAMHRDAAVICRQHPGGGFSLALPHGSFAEQSLFAECLHQVLSPIDDPRYLITRRQRRLRRLMLDCHAVPTVLGVRKLRAEAFLAAWRRRVAPGELVFTRSEDGRRMLLHARLHAFANARERTVQRLDRWF